MFCDDRKSAFGQGFNFSAKHRLTKPPKKLLVPIETVHWPKINQKLKNNPQRTLPQ